jgi:hypothetical protein
MSKATEIGMIIVVQECSDGNETVGDRWLETKTFLPQQPLSDVIDWKDRLRRSGGRTYITEESDR